MRRAPIADFLVPEGFAAPSGLRALAREGSVVQEAIAYRRQARAVRTSLRAVPYVNRTAGRSGGDPVLLVPGFLAGDYTLGAMSGHLRDLGYRTYRTGILANAGCLDRGTAALERRLEAIADRRERKVAIVGHSLGGMMARGLAARRPDLVAGIVTLGSPMLAPGAAHRLLVSQVRLLRWLSGLGLTRLMGDDCTSGACALQMWEESRRPLPAGFPFTAVYSKRDGITDWRACIDPAAQPRQVRSSHVGMALDPEVLAVVVETLAAIGGPGPLRVNAPRARWAADPRARAGRHPGATP